MGQPVKLSDGLLNEARVAGAAMGRSMAGQVEFWATVGRALERVANRTQLERLQAGTVLSVSEVVSTINAPSGRDRLQAYLESKPYPRFSPHPELPDTFYREDAEDSRTLGRFRRGVFEPLNQPETSL
jgi:hypothetical protein